MRIHNKNYFQSELELCEPTVPHICLKGAVQDTVYYWDKLNVQFVFTVSIEEEGHTVRLQLWRESDGVLNQCLVIWLTLMSVFTDCLSPTLGHAPFSDVLSDADVSCASFNIPRAVSSAVSRFTFQIVFRFHSWMWKLKQNSSVATFYWNKRKGMIKSLRPHLPA